MSNLEAHSLATLCEDVQHNCAISDARYARDYSLCVYLLRMREFYRWRFDLPLTQALEIDSIGSWISETEAHWDDIEETDFKPLVLGNTQIDPFDSNAVNKFLQPAGLIYTAGIGRLSQPHFVLAELTEKTCSGTVTSFECGLELARDSITLPAMAQNETIYIRLDSVKRHLWQMLDEWRLQKKPGPFANVVQHFNLEDTSRLDQPLEEAAKQLSRLYHAHEMGEVRAGRLLGDQYHTVLERVAGTRNEFYLRAVRDILADSLETWPYLLTQRSEIDTDFWIASLAGARQELLKASGLINRLNTPKKDTRKQSRFDRLADLFLAERKHWQTIADEILTVAAKTSDVDIKTLAFDLIELHFASAKNATN